MQELKKSVDAGKVFFGVKQTIKNSGKINFVFLPSDARDETVKALGDKGIEFDFLELNKKEIAQKLELDFMCEVFGLTK